MPQGCWHTDGVSHESSSGGLAGFTKCSAHRRLKGPINRLLGQLPLDNSLGMLISPVFTHVFQKVSPVLTSYFCRYPEQSPPGKDSARPSIEPFGSSDLQRLSTWPGLTSTSQPTAPGVTDALNRPYTSWLAVPLSQKLAGRIAGPVDPKGFSQVHACRTPHLTYLLGRVNYYKKYLPQRPIIKRDSRGQRRSAAAFMRTLRWKFPVSLNAGEFTLGCKNHTYCYISSLYLLSSAEITAVCAAS